MDNYNLIFETNLNYRFKPKKRGEYDNIYIFNKYKGLIFCETDRNIYWNRYLDTYEYRIPILFEPDDEIKRRYHEFDSSEKVFINGIRVGIGFIVFLRTFVANWVLANYKHCAFNKIKFEVNFSTKSVKIYKSKEKTLHENIIFSGESDKYFLLNPIVFEMKKEITNFGVIDISRVLNQLNIRSVPFRNRRNLHVGEHPSDDMLREIGEIGRRGIRDPDSASRHE